MPLPPDAFDEMLVRVMESLPPVEFEVARGSEALTVTGYLNERAGGKGSGMGEVPRNATFYVVSGGLQPGDVLDGSYVVYDTAPSYGFQQAWKLLRVPPFEAMRQYTLAFQVASGWTTDPDTGNRIPTRATANVVAVLQAAKEPRLLDIMGVRPGEVVLEGYAVEPKSLPDGVVEGSRATLEIDGVAGTFVLGPKIPDPMPAKRVAFGEYLVGKWTWQGE